MPGKYWYAAMGFVYDSKGAIAVQEAGKWKGSLDSAASIEGLTRWKNIVDKYSKADKSGDEGGQWEVFAGGNVAMSYSNGWETCCIAPQKGAFFPMPSIRAGEYMPAFLGGSNLGVPAKAKILTGASIGSSHSHQAKQCERLSKLAIFLTTPAC